MFVCVCVCSCVCVWVGLCIASPPSVILSAYIYSHLFTWFGVSMSSPPPSLSFSFNSFFLTNSSLNPKHLFLSPSHSFFRIRCKTDKIAFFHFKSRCSSITQKWKMTKKIHEMLFEKFYNACWRWFCPFLSFKTLLVQCYLNF